MNRDLESMKRLYSEFVKLSNSHPIEFLLNSRKMYDEMSCLIEKSVNGNIFKKDSLEVRADDYPRELEQRREREHKYAKFDEITNLKDTIIKKLILNQKSEVEKVKSFMEKSTKEEMGEWEKLTDKFAQQLQKYQMICAYCLISLDDNSVNSECQKNHDITEFQHRFTYEQPPKSFHGTSRHFFSKPIRELFEGEYKKTIKPIIKKTPIQIFFENQSENIRQVCMESKTDLATILKQHDKQRLGTLNYIQFSYIMNEVCKVSQDDVSTMIKYIDTNQSKSINYDELLRALYDPEYFSETKNKERYGTL